MLTSYRRLLTHVGIFFLAAVLMGPVAYAQTPPVVEPSIQEARVQIERGRDIVQPPTLLYQRGRYVDRQAYPDSVVWHRPDSLGVLRIPCCDTGEPDAITYPDAINRFPVNLQVATFVRDGQISELPISQSVVDGRRPARIIIKPPQEDRWDIAIPLPREVRSVVQQPGDSTVVDARTWYRNALRNPVTGQMAPPDSFNTVRELRGQLLSTAPGGETVFFLIVARQSRTPPDPLPIAEQRLRIIPPDTLIVFPRLPPPRLPNLDWKTTTALLVGPNRADIPGRSGAYRATRVKGDVRSTLRWWPTPTESYLFTVFGSSQATFGNTGNHHDVPYGLAIAARFGGVTAVELRAEASYEDDPFQLQGFRSGDERLRLMLGYDYMSVNSNRRVSIGPTYYRDLQSSWEGARSDARELGISIEGVWEERLQIGRFPFMLESSTVLNQSWGYVRDTGNSNTTVAGRLAAKPQFRISSTLVSFGPVMYLQYVNNEYAAIQGFSELNAQFGMELTSHILF